MCEKECDDACACYRAGYLEAEQAKKDEIDELRSDINKLEQERDDLLDRITRAKDELA